MRIILLILLIFTTVNSYADEMLITQGRATTDIENLYECGSRYRKSGIGHFIDQNLVGGSRIGYPLPTERLVPAR